MLRFELLAIVEQCTSASAARAEHGVDTKAWAQWCADNDASATYAPARIDTAPTAKAVTKDAGAGSGLTLVKI